MKNQLKVVGVQANLVWEHPKENISFFETQINNLEDDIDLIILPEMFTTGFTMKPSKNAEKIDGKTVSWMQQIANKKQLAICGSLIIEENNEYFNQFIFVKPDKNIITYTKRHSFTLAGEDKVYTSGNKKIIIDYLGWKICPLICYDLRFPVWIRNTENYDLLLFVANWPVTRIKAWDILLKARAIENMSYTIGINRIGKDANNYEYSGNSLVVDFLGEELSSLPKNENGIVKAVLDKKKQTKIREKLDFLSDKDCFIIQ